MAPSKAALAAAAAASQNVSSTDPARLAMNPKKLDALLEASEDYARKKVAGVFSKSQVVDLENLEPYPEFHQEELVAGKYLGKGGFCTVYEIKSINLDANASSKKKKKKKVCRSPNTESTYCDDDADYEDDQDRTFIAQHCMRGSSSKKSSRYAMKKLSSDVLKDPARFVQGVMDMGTETYFLSAIEHPNIVKLRATASDCSPFSKDYFIVIDKLCEILTQKIKSWEKQFKKCSGLLKSKAVKIATQKALLEERLVAAFDLCAAMAYLHGKRIVYRDLKPENIGFDVRGDIKLFDFGLAREVHAYEEEVVDGQKQGTYKLSGMTGSIRYMAPEVFKEQPYNFSCDTYSFAMLLWEMLAMETPFKGYNSRLFIEKVIHGGFRPAIPEKKTKKKGGATADEEGLFLWPSEVSKSILQQGWSADLVSRPSMEECTQILKQTIVEMRKGDESGLEHKTRRSTYIMPKK